MLEDIEEEGRGSTQSVRRGEKEERRERNKAWREKRERREEVGEVGEAGLRDLLETALACGACTQVSWGTTKHADNLEKQMADGKTVVVFET